MDKIEHFLEKVRMRLPFKEEIRDTMVAELREDLQEVQKEGKDIYQVFGSPEITAKNLVSGMQHTYVQASWKRRSAAYAIDLLLYIVLAGIFIVTPTLYMIFSLGIEDGEALPLEEAWPFILFLLFLPIIMMGIYTIFAWMEKGGQTIGKKVMDIYTVDISGTTISWSQAFVRGFPKFFFTEFLAFDFILGYMLRKEERGFQKATDLMADTRVIQHH